MIAEDLGFLTDSVRELLAESGYPGMKVLQFAFDESGESVYLPFRYDKNCIVYTGTHDNETTKGWLGNLTQSNRACMNQYTACEDKDTDECVWGAYPGGTVLSSRSVRSTFAGLSLSWK